MQYGGKYCNVVDTPICHFMQRFEYGKSWLVGSHWGRWGLALGNNFYTIPLDDDIHRFIKCLVTHITWKYLLDVWQVSTCFYLRPQQRGFFLVSSKCSKWGVGDIVPIFTIMGLQHNWNIHNAFMSNGRIGWKPIWRSWKAPLMWNFWMLEQSAYSTFILAL